MLDFAALGQKIRPPRLRVKSLFIFCLGLIALLPYRCRQRPDDLAEMRALFATAPYIAQGDGWGEARRRRFIQRWFEAHGFQVSSAQHDFGGLRAGGKYRQVLLTAVRPGAKAGPAADVTLSVIHPPRTLDNEFAQRQRECDKQLFAVLSDLRRYTTIRLHMSETCLGLTAYQDKAE